MVSDGRGNSHTGQPAPVTGFLSGGSLAVLCEAAFYLLCRHYCTQQVALKVRPRHRFEISCLRGTFDALRHQVWAHDSGKDQP